MFRRWWHHHSLSIVTISSGFLILAVAYPFEEGRWFDFISGVGNTLLAIALGGILSGIFRETNKPEE